MSNLLSTARGRQHIRRKSTSDLASFFTSSSCLRASSRPHSSKQPICNISWFSHRKEKSSMEVHKAFQSSTICTIHQIGQVFYSLIEDRPARNPRGRFLGQPSHFRYSLGRIASSERFFECFGECSGGLAWVECRNTFTLPFDFWCICWNISFSFS
ncbi:hypothetical protein V8G54_034402 [Vigna mungo]|uniref:Uncharacterized protein n=1 Tax=Vigna mungo TaxID=3915 RepID=A0AAQ3MR45_VIGMU